MSGVLLRPNLRQIADACTERELSDAIVDAARKLGWLVARWPTWRATGTYAGVPDLLLARGGRCLHIELKTEKGRLSEHQEAWRAALPEADYRLYRPSDWVGGIIEEELR